MDFLFKDETLECLGKLIKDKLNDKAEVHCKENGHEPIQIVNSVYYSAIPIANIEYPALQLYRMNWEEGRNNSVLTSTIRLQYMLTSADIQKLGGVLDWIAKNLITILKEITISEQYLTNGAKLNYIPIRFDASLSSNIQSQATYPYITGMISIQE